MPAPIILQDQSGLAEGIAGAGSALAAALGQRMQESRQDAKQKQYGGILEKTLGALPEGASPMQVTKAMSAAMKEGVPADVVQKHGALYATLNKGQGKEPPGPEQIDKMAGLFKKFGMPEDIAQRNAQLWGELTVGGQTEMAKYLVDQIARGDYTKSEYAPGQFNQTNETNPNLGFQPIGEEAVVGEAEVEEFKWPKVDIFEGKTPKERNSLKVDLLKENNKEYKENEEKLRKTDEEIMRYDQLERLNDSKKLPENMQRLNINWTTGDIRVPWLANEETQLFVKTINDFTVAAKDTFGARVTNFELGAFMKRLPTLANSEAGRRLILEQMKAMKGLDRLYNDSIRQVYDKYGAQGIDRQNAERIARDLRKEDEAQLKSDFSNAIKAQETYDLRQRAPEGRIPVRKPNGETGYLPVDQIDRAKKKGWEIL